VYPIQKNLSRAISLKVLIFGSLISIVVCLTVIFYPFLFTLTRSRGIRSAYFEQHYINIPPFWVIENADRHHLLLKKPAKTILARFDSVIDISSFLLGPSDDANRHRAFWLQAHGISDLSKTDDVQTGGSEISVNGMLCVQTQNKFTRDVVSVSCLSNNSKYSAEFLGYESDTKTFNYVISQLSNIMNNP
jgi:hypothetical protein